MAENLNHFNEFSKIVLKMQYVERLVDAKPHLL